MNKLKKLMAFALALTMCGSMAGCGNENVETPPNTAGNAAPDTDDDDTPDTGDNETPDTDDDDTPDTADDAAAGSTFGENSVRYAYDMDSDSAFKVEDGNWVFASTTTNRKHAGHLEDGTLICDIDSMKSDISYEIGSDSITFDVEDQTFTLSFVDGAEYKTRAELINDSIRNIGKSVDDDSDADPSETEKEEVSEEDPEPEKDYIYLQDDFTQRPDGPMIDNNNYDNAYLNPSLWEQYDPSMKGDPDSLFPYGSPYVDWVGMNVGKTWYGLDESYTYDDYKNNNLSSADKSIEFDLIVKPVNDRSETDFDSVEDIDISYTLNIDDKVYFGSVPAKDLAWPASTKYDYMIESQGATIIWSIYDYPKTPLGELLGQALIMSLHIEDGDYVTDRYLYAIMTV